ncbi:MAG: type II-A CRISPR-associated protein Csn2 [Candidatus Fimenecus sp.]
MKIIYYDFNIEIDFEYGQISSIIIENPIVLDRFVVALNDLINKKDEKISVFEGLEKKRFWKGSRCNFFSYRTYIQ